MCLLVVCALVRAGLAGILCSSVRILKYFRARMGREEGCQGGLRLWRIVIFHPAADAQIAPFDLNLPPSTLRSARRTLRSPSVLQGQGLEECASRLLIRALSPLHNILVRYETRTRHPRTTSSQCLRTLGIFMESWVRIRIIPLLSHSVHVAHKLRHTYTARHRHGLPTMVNHTYPFRTCLSSRVGYIVQHRSRHNYSMTTSHQPVLTKS